MPVGKSGRAVDWDVVAGRLLRADLAQARALHGALEDRMLNVQPGSATAADDQLTSPHQLSHSVAGMVNSALDHLQTLADLVEHAALRPIPPYTLCRAAIENSAGAWWIIGSAERSERVTRRLQSAHADLNDSRTVFTELGQEMRPTYDQRRQRLVDSAERAGLDPSVISKRIPWVGIVKHADDTLELGELGALVMWRVCSGFTHGRPWASLAVLRRGEQKPVGDDDEFRVEMSASIPAVGAATRIALRILEATMDRADHRRKRWVGDGPDVEQPRPSDDCLAARATRAIVPPLGL